MWYIQGFHQFIFVFCIELSYLCVVGFCNFSESGYFSSAANFFGVSVPTCILVVGLVVNVLLKSVDNEVVG